MPYPACLYGKHFSVSLSPTFLSLSTLPFPSFPFLLYLFFLLGPVISWTTFKGTPVELGDCVAPRWTQIFAFK